MEVTGRGEDFFIIRGGAVAKGLALEKLPTAAKWSEQQLPALPADSRCK